MRNLHKILANTQFQDHVVATKVFKMVTKDVGQINLRSRMIMQGPNNCVDMEIFYSFIR